MAKFSPNGLAQQIESLLNAKLEHQSAIEAIDATLEQIQSMLRGGITPARRGRPPGSGNVAGKGAKTGPQRGGRRKRRTFATSGDESILAFIKKAGSPTTKEVNQHWKSEGRGGSADNALTKLVKIKKLKRINTPGERGSKYSIA